jgi:predicted  nucleic acid-binding Zn-ribbon protein
VAYKCVHCGNVYEDGANEVLNGCECKSKFFFYINAEKLKEINEGITPEVILTKAEKKVMESEVREIAGIGNEDKPVFLDFESVRVIKQGKYLIDIQKLFSTNKPRIYKLEDGKYIIDLTMLSKSINVDKGN